MVNTTDIVILIGGVALLHSQQGRVLLQEALLEIFRQLGGILIHHNDLCPERHTILEHNINIGQVHGVIKSNHHDAQHKTNQNQA